ncbi:alpha/beta hydrolase [Actinomadura parmotrematis]|uniref:Alpha/beta hydrolase n=1 Tax=Actinomadura parmotrematis TaxID=2864039 RepID=A0ABS7FK58_9ACTN|nr:alpha/beta hydrolase [Actinomadura parmotrematis]MBW8480731.1 alpha/beta hydrolase [Actinomadura parmotrematis]
MEPSLELRPGTSVRARLAAQGLRATIRPVLTHWPLSARALRPAFAIDLAAPLALPAPRWARVERVAFDGFCAEWVRAPGADESRAVLYFHGGGFFSCGLRTHRRMVARLAAAAGAPVLSVGYRQLPAAPLATSVADCADAYRWLLGQGVDASRIAVAGDSAGGFLAFAAPLRAMAAGLPAPGAIVALSPLTDLDHTAKVAHDNARLDAYLPARRVERLAGLLTEGAVPLDPLVSPVNADLAALPPVLIQVGSTEMLLPDAELMAERLAAAGVPCRLQVWEGQVHVFQVLADLVPEGVAALHEAGAFVREHTLPRAEPPARRRPRRRRRALAA